MGELRSPFPHEFRTPAFGGILENGGKGIRLSSWQSLPNMPETGAFPRRVSAVISYLHPFRIVHKDHSTKWDVTIEQINNRTWDYVKLHEIVGAIDVGLMAPYHLVVGADGALALPPVPELRSVTKAVEFFNRCLAAFVVGGIYCEAVTLDSVEIGSILDWRYIRASGSSTSFVGQFHNTVRTKTASVLHAIYLLRPRILHFEDLNRAAQHGFAVLSRVPEIRPEFLLKGISGIARRDWGSALSNLWIVIEQITWHLWRKYVLQSVEAEKPIPGRQDQLKDNRSWTVAMKHELLHRIGKISTETLAALALARRSRNDLLHQGTHPNEESSMAAFSAMRGLMLVVVEMQDLPIFGINLADHMLSDPFQPVPITSTASFDYWMPIPKLPGEEDIERAETESRRFQEPEQR